MATAPLSAGWQRRARNRPGPQMGAEAIGGAPLLPQELGANARVRIRWQPGGVWVDITRDVLQHDGREATMTVGRGDESSQAQPATCTLTVDNNSGDYTPDNPLSKNWPNVIDNVRLIVDVSLDGGYTWITRFDGKTTSYTPGWDTSAHVAVVTILASGESRRLNQGKTPLKSALYRAITTAAVQPLVYWSMEDASGSTQAASGLQTGVPMQFSAPYPTFASSGPRGSAPVVEFGPSGSTDTRFGNVMTVPASATDTYWSTQAVAAFSADSTSVGSYTFLEWRSAGSWTEYWGWVNQLNGALILFGVDASTGVATGLVQDTSIDYRDGVFRLIRFEATRSGGNVVFRIYRDGVNTATATVAGSMAHIANIVIGSYGLLGGPMWVGHVGTYDQAPTDFTSAMNGFPGESPADRMARLCSEEGVTFQTAGFYEASISMGPQGVDTFTNLLHDCETADAGFLYDGTADGWTYQGISQRYDQATALTLDFSAGEVAPTFLPIYDDQRRVNKVKASRKNGSSEVAEDTTSPLRTTGIGVYDNEVTMNSVDDTRLYDRANWEVHAGTLRGMRYPTVTLNLRAAPSVVSRWLSRADGVSGPVVPGCRIDVTNVVDVFTQHPVGTVELMMEGYTEVIGPRVWTVTMNTHSNRMYDVFKIGDSDLGRVQTAGSTIHADAAAGAGTVQVDYTDPAGWTTAAGDFPMYVYMDGIKVTVTSISGGTSPQTFTVDPSTVTKQLLTGREVRNWRQAPLKY